MSVRNDDNIIKSLVILAVCIVAMLMVCTECALLPQYGWLWLILLLILDICMLEVKNPLLRNVKFFTH